MSPRRHVQVRLAIRSQIELVQNPLPPAGAAAATATAGGAIAAAAAAAAATSLPARHPRSTAAVAAATQADELPGSQSPAKRRNHDAQPRRLQELQLAQHQLARISQQRQLRRGLREESGLRRTFQLPAAAYRAFTGARFALSEQGNDGPAAWLPPRQHVAAAVAFSAAT